MSAMFQGAGQASPDVSKWDTANVLYLGAMFYRTDPPPHPDVSAWNTTQVRDMQAMFAGMTYPPLDLSSWDFAQHQKNGRHV